MSYKIDEEQLALPRPVNLCNCVLRSHCVASFANPHFARFIKVPFRSFMCFSFGSLRARTHVTQSKTHMNHLTWKTAQLITNQCNTSVERHVGQNVNNGCGATRSLCPVDRRLLSVRGHGMAWQSLTGNKMESFNDSNNSNNNNSNRPRIKRLFVVIVVVVVLSLVIKNFLFHFGQSRKFQGSAYGKTSCTSKCKQ